jgi:hypothetical protein
VTRARSIERLNIHLLARLERSDDDLDAIGRCQPHLGGVDGRFNQTAIAADDPEGDTGQREGDVARARDVHEPPPFHLSGSDIQRRPQTPVQ